MDNDDCFIHTLANYARQTGAEVVTYRAGFPPELIARIRAAPDPDLAGSRAGRADFGVPDLVKYAAHAGVPVFGVCLGLQGIVEAFGGELGVLDYPMHGKPSTVRASRHGRLRRTAGAISRWAAIIRSSRARETFPACLEVTAETRRRRHHGRPASRTADRSGAVPSGVDPDLRWQLRPAIDRKCGGSGLWDPARSIPGKASPIVPIGRMGYYANLRADFMQFDLSDIVFLVVVLSIAVLLLNSSGGGGGHRARVPVRG